MVTVVDLQSILERTKIRVIEETDDLIKFRIQGYRENFFILKSELENFIKIKDSLIAEPETSIYFPGYYEQLLDTTEAIFIYHTKYVAEKFSLNSLDQKLSMSISSPSLFFVMNVLSNKDFLTFSQKGREKYRDLEIGTVNDEVMFKFCEALGRYRTIRIQATEKSAYFNKKQRLYKLAEAGLFNLAYCHGISYHLSHAWEKKTYHFIPKLRETIQFPKKIYISELVSYYKLALSSDSLMLSFLAMYKILEYFFISAAENELHKRLIGKLIDPEFTHTRSSQLRALASLIRKHDQRMDEQRMLSTVLEYYFMPDEIANWVLKHEKQSQPYFTIPQEVFGQTFTLDLTPPNIAPSIARRIYHIRNVMVHNKEGEATRFIPFSDHEAILSNEIPIILFLAEQLILRTGEDL